MADTENRLTVAVEASRESPTETTVEARDFTLTVDEPEELGGSDEGANPLEYLLVGQAGCLNVTAHQVAEDMDVPLRDLEIGISGEFDVETFMQERPDERTGLRDIAVSMTVDSDADRETLEEWAERVEQRCPVSDNIKNETSVTVSVEGD